MTVTVVTGAASGMGRSCVDRLRGTTDHLIAVDLEAPEIEGAEGMACDVSDPVAIARLVERVQELGAFRALAHAAGVSPTMADARRVLEVDLVGTALLLEAFEPLVVPGSAAVCWSSSSAYQIAPSGAIPSVTRGSTCPCRPTSSTAWCSWSPTAARPTPGPSGV